MFCRVSDISSRKKQPELVRKNLLDAAERLFIERGWGNFPLSLVAEQAGVSKGGLLHHFPSKQHLLESIMEDVFSFVTAHIEKAMSEDPVEDGRFIRAYLSLALLSNDDPRKELLCAVSMAIPSDDVEMHRKWDDWFYTRLKESRHYVRDMIIKSALDGIFLELRKGVEIKDELFHLIVQRLMMITKMKDDPIAMDELLKVKI